MLQWSENGPLRSADGRACNYLKSTTVLRFRGAPLGDHSIPDVEVVAAIEATMVVRCICMCLMSAESQLLLHVNVKKSVSMLSAV